MSTHTQILYHLVFGSKGHIPFLTSKNNELLFAYISRILKNKFCNSYIVGGSVNHIHIITHIHPTESLAYLIKDIKESTHYMMNQERYLFNDFSEWQIGYSGFTYHISSKQSLINYVKNQDKHHKTITYKDEIIKLLKENDVVFSEKYIMK